MNEDAVEGADRRAGVAPRNLLAPEIAKHRSHPKIVIAGVTGLFVVLVIVAAATSGGDSSKTASSTGTTSTESATTSATSATTTATATAAAATPTPQQKVKASVDDTVAAGGYAGDVQIHKVSSIRTSPASLRKRPKEV